MQVHQLSQGNLLHEQWDEADLLEYLLARHRARCGPVAAGLRLTADAWQLQGIPELWTLTLDFLANHPRVLPVLKALRFAFMEMLKKDETRTQRMQLRPFPELRFLSRTPLRARQ